MEILTMNDYDDFEEDFYFEEWDNLSEGERGNLWSFWAGKGNDYPDIVREKAEEFNVSLGKDIHAHEGFRITYFMFKYGYTQNEIEEWLDPSNNNYAKVFYSREGK